MITFRRERPGDEEGIRRVNEEAFGQPGEADLIDALRRRGACRVSLVAEEDGRIIGHILFTPVTIDGAKPLPDAVGLGPLAVLPSHQRRGIGANLIRLGLEECRKDGCEIAVVLGHPTYYPCFGFQRRTSPASAASSRSPRRPSWSCPCAKGRLTAAAAS